MEQVEKEILTEITQKGDNIELDEIQEGWEIIKTIQHKTRKFLEEINGYKNEIATLQVQLRILRKEVLSTQEQIQSLTNKKTALNEELESLQKQLDIKKLQHSAHLQQQNIVDKRNKILPGALKSIEIYLKDGSTTKAKPAQKVFSEDLYKKYRVELKENHILKNKISELELENKRLEIELRDFYTDLKLEGMGAIEPKNAKQQHKALNIENLDFQDLLEFKEIIADAAHDENSTKKS